MTKQTTLATVVGAVTGCTLLLITHVSPSVVYAQDALTTDGAKFSYALGFRIAQQIKGQSERDKVEIDINALTGALQDVFSGADLKLTQEEMQAAFQSQSQKVQSERDQASGANVETGDKFREEYAKGEGVTKTDSGILYKVLTAGEGKKPAADSTVVVHYEGTTTDGKEFDSSYKRGQPATFQLGGIIKGWQEVLQLMTAGSTYEVVIPPELAYGPQGSPGGIGPNSTLKFKIELIEVK